MKNDSAKGDKNNNEERKRIEKMAAGHHAASQKEKEKEIQMEEDEEITCDTTDDETEDESSTETDEEFFRSYALPYQTFTAALTRRKNLIEAAIAAKTTRWGIEEKLIDIMEDAIKDFVREKEGDPDYLYSHENKRSDYERMLDTIGTEWVDAEMQLINQSKTSHFLPRRLHVSSCGK